MENRNAWFSKSLWRDASPLSHRQFISLCATGRTMIAEEINCTAWGCDQPGNNNQAEYFVWWMQNIPGPNNTNYDESGNPMPNWWAALYIDL